jgi:hypothetical protein
MHEQVYLQSPVRLSDFVYKKSISFPNIIVSEKIGSSANDETIVAVTQHISNGCWVW